MRVLDHRLLQAHSFAVMDPCVVEVTHWPELPAVSLAPRQLASRSQLLPFLLDLRNLSPDEVGNVLDAVARWENASAAPFFSALVSAPGDSQHVADSLKPRFIVRRPGSSNRALLRWHDPQVFEHLLRIFSPARINHLLQPMEKWSWRNRQGAWITTRPVVERFGSRGMDEATWRQLGRVAVLNRVLNDAEMSADRTCGDDMADTALTLLNRAYDVHGFTEEADCRLYVKQALQYGEAIHAHPGLITCLEQARAGTATYVGACSRLSANDLRAWAQSHSHPRTEQYGV